MVAFTVLVATLVNQFESLIGLVSGLSLSMMAFILPPLLHIKLHWGQMFGRNMRPTMTVMFFVDIVIITFGFVAAGTTTYVSIKGIVDNGIGF